MPYDFTLQNLCDAATWVDDQIGASGALSVGVGAAFGVVRSGLLNPDG